MALKEYTVEKYLSIVVRVGNVLNRNKRNIKDEDQYRKMTRQAFDREVTD